MLSGRVYVFAAFIKVVREEKRENIGRRERAGEEVEDGGRGVVIVLERLLLCSVALICFFPIPLLVLLIHCWIIPLMIH